MTEDEAKTKVCCGPPFTEFEWGDLHQRNCIASACMAWRTRVKSTGVATATNDGFCGLAGAPQ